MKKRILEFIIKLLIVYTAAALGAYGGYVYGKPIVKALLKERIVTCTFEIQIWPVDREARAEIAREAQENDVHGRP